MPPYPALPLTEAECVAAVRLVESQLRLSVSIFHELFTHPARRIATPCFLPVNVPPALEKLGDAMTVDDVNGAQVSVADAAPRTDLEILHLRKINMKSMDWTLLQIFSKFQTHVLAMFSVLINDLQLENNLFRSRNVELETIHKRQSDVTRELKEELRRRDEESRHLSTMMAHKEKEWGLEKARLVEQISSLNLALEAERRTPKDVLAKIRELESQMKAKLDQQKKEHDAEIKALKEELFAKQLALDDALSRVHVPAAVADICLQTDPEAGPPRHDAEVSCDLGSADLQAKIEKLKEKVRIAKELLELDRDLVQQQKHGPVSPRSAQSGRVAKLRLLERLEARALEMLEKLRVLKLEFDAVERARLERVLSSNQKLIVSPGPPTHPSLDASPLSHPQGSIPFLPDSDDLLGGRDSISPAGRFHPSRRSPQSGKLAVGGGFMVASPRSPVKRGAKVG